MLFLLLHGVAGVVTPPATHNACARHYSSTHAWLLACTYVADDAVLLYIVSGGHVACYVHVFSPCMWTHAPTHAWVHTSLTQGFTLTRHTHSPSYDAHTMTHTCTQSQRHIHMPMPTCPQSHTCTCTCMHIPTCTLARAHVHISWCWCCMVVWLPLFHMVQS